MASRSFETTSSLLGLNGNADYSGQLKRKGLIQNQGHRSFCIHTSYPPLPMPYLIVATCVLALTCGATVYWLWLRSRRSAPWIAPEKIQMDDSMLGQLTVSLPVVGQNQSQGFVEFTRKLAGSSVEFSNSFIDETGGTEGLDIAISELQAYFQMVADGERMKSVKNLIPSQLKIHNILMPNSRLTASELISTVKLCSVAVMGSEQAWFQFSSPRFLNGRPICVTVNRNGDVEFVGTG